VVDASESRGPYIGVLHANIVLGSIRRNIECLRKIVAYIHDYNIALLILPYMHPYGPIITPETAGSLSVENLKNYVLTTRTGYLHDLITLAKNYSINIFLPGYIECAGPRKYISAILVKGESGEIIRYRKMFITDYEKNMGISPGSRLQTFNIGMISFSVMLDSELFYPELARLNLLFSDFLIVAIPQNASLKHYDSIVRTISRVNRAYTIVPGARVYKSSVLYDAIPTIVINSDGDIEYKYGEDEQGLILIPASKLRRDRGAFSDELKKLYSLFKAIVNKKGAYNGAGESYSHKDA